MFKTEIINGVKYKVIEFDSSVEDKLIRKKPGFPYGLATGGNNWLEDNITSKQIKMGITTDIDIINEYKKMLIKVDGQRTPVLVNDQGELKTFPTKSRWNTEYNYSWIVGQKALDQVKGLRRVKHLILTFSPDKLEGMLPEWWYFGIEAYAAVMGGYLISDFLRKYRAYKKRNGQKNNFITWVMEFTEKGLVHFHVLFFGVWVASIDDLAEMWPYCDKNGIRFGKPIKHQDNGAVLASYLTRYITKSLSNIGGDNPLIKKKMFLIRALLWIYRKRLYNMRHKVKNLDGLYTLGIGRDQYISKVKWKRYINETSQENEPLENMFDKFKNSHEYS
jgi:hypothetical protein